MKTRLACLLLLTVLFTACNHHPNPRSITVTGLGEIKAVPDQATYSISLLARNAAAAAAVNEVNTNAQTLVDLLQKAGIEKKDITTTSGGVNPNYDNYTAGKIIGYTANYSVSVIFHDIAKVSKVMADVSGQPGIGNVNGPDLGFSDPVKFENDALAKAFENAKSKAEALAKAGGLVLKEPVTIRTSDASGPRPMPMMFATRAMAKSNVASAPIEPGEQTVSVSVEVTFGAALP